LYLHGFPSFHDNSQRIHRIPVRGDPTRASHDHISYTHPPLFRHHPRRHESHMMSFHLVLGWGGSSVFVTPGAANATQLCVYQRSSDLVERVSLFPTGGAQARGGCASTVRGPEAGTGGTTCVAWGGAVGGSRAPTVHRQGLCVQSDVCLALFSPLHPPQRYLRDTHQLTPVVLLPPNRWSSHCRDLTLRGFLNVSGVPLCIA
jgi:hypothetical protein